MSWARQETLTDYGGARGTRPYGKHAGKNIGLSIVREGRELDLDRSWSNDDSIDRWWGVEVEFPSTLDEVFGVTNTKQNATILSQMSKFEWKSEADPGESMSEFCRRIQDEGDPRVLLLPIADHIREQIKVVRKRLQAQSSIHRKIKNKERHDGPDVADQATTKFRERAAQGHAIESDSTEFTEEDSEKFKQDLMDDKQYPENVAEKIANATLIRRRKVAFLTKAMEGYAFFNTEQQQGGVTAVVFNTEHPFYEQLMESLEPKIGDESDADLIDRIHRAADTLELLFAAWARYELEEVGQKERLFGMRQEWGKMARFFLTEQEDD